MAASACASLLLFSERTRKTCNMACATPTPTPKFNTYDGMLDRLRRDINYSNVEGINFDSLITFKEFLVNQYLKFMGLEDHYNQLYSSVVDAYCSYNIEDQREGDLYDAIVDSDQDKMNKYLQNLDDYVNNK